MLLLLSLIFLSIFAFSLLGLNLLIFIINGIILLNVLFVINYYLYNILKNSIFLVKFINFILKNIALIIFWFIILSILCIIYLFLFGHEAYAESPPDTRHLQHLIQNTDLGNTFLTKSREFYTQKVMFDKNVKEFSLVYNNVIDNVEYVKGISISQIVPLSEVYDPSLEDTLMDRLHISKNEIREEADVLLGKVQELQAIDYKLHFISDTKFDNTKYQNLNLHFLQFRSNQWPAVQHPNKILTPLKDLKNRYF